MQFDGWLIQEEVNYVRPWRMNGPDSFNEKMSGGVMGADQGVNQEEQKGDLKTVDILGLKVKVGTVEVVRCL